MIKFAAIPLTALALTLASCDNSSGQGADGYTFEKRERNPATHSIRVVEYDTLQQLQAAIPPGHVPEGRELQAWGTINKSGTQCTIHVLRPERSYKPEWIGHEAAHCFWGRWHNN